MNASVVRLPGHMRISAWSLVFVKVGTSKWKTGYRLISYIKRNYDSTDLIRLMYKNHRLKTFHNIKGIVYYINGNYQVFETDIDPASIDNVYADPVIRNPDKSPVKFTRLSKIEWLFL